MVRDFVLEGGGRGAFFLFFLFFLFLSFFPQPFLYIDLISVLRIDVRCTIMIWKAGDDCW